ncbi:unnamed protein product [Rhizophagus irregularis]|nr:unnamed protein product [Rhizophagus irregularis]CAB5391681.1 unnamed protein product [Rhizophagus irregularis]
MFLNISHMKVGVFVRMDQEYLFNKVREIHVWSVSSLNTTTGNNEKVVKKNRRIKRMHAFSVQLHRICFMESIAWIKYQFVSYHMHQMLENNELDISHVIFTTLY